jgi:hypothetical protein
VRRELGKLIAAIRVLWLSAPIMSSCVAEETGRKKCNKRERGELVPD